MLYKAVIPASVYHVLLAHALSTENEEVIGMLIGDWEDLPSHNPFMKARTTAWVRSVSLLTRSDKRKDRVEIAPEQLHLAALQAEEASAKLGRAVRVMGWYHSHPHITVFPSHVDLNTQLSQQYLDTRFFGIIISCFDSQSDASQRVQITCFQSETLHDGTTLHVNVPLEIVPDAAFPSLEHEQALMRETFFDLPLRMYEEHKSEFEAATKRIHYHIQRTANSEQRDEVNEQQKPLANVVTDIYNAGVYGQSITHLVDNVICPATQLLELKSKALSQEMRLLEAKRDELLSRLNNDLLTFE
ncbi:JAB1/Mov34/MPN/PAD-1 ubiquitin protease-domain-containing protein [Syncephalastrum racemosum]|uniref:JAB1/Mov34/MPN/PAD-1 ubiquitin protease-domain-containing protein n=1 Tax=Syncephalastrum racemosum TaxID=13706 RepID=A0A1X2HVJ6_SYNRA|nr:JAB1/Mov34/MPN/PAD-1 ubiquitin protease-domain-containing protein [Syncephalastrum racemosum]